MIRVKNFFTSRLFFVFVLAAVMFGSLIWRLFELQIIKGDSYQEVFLETSTKTVKEDYTRGTIFDRNGYPLAYNKLSYTVKIVDDGTYNPYERNLMIVRLINILNVNQEKFTPALSIAYENGKYVFTSATERSHKRFLTDVGVYNPKEGATKEQSHEISWYTADYVVEKLADRYGYGYTLKRGRKIKTYDLSPEDLLKLIDIRYALSLNSGQKYIAATVAMDVSAETVADIMEHEYELSGVQIESDSVRTYEDAEYFAHLIGYTGEVSATELENLDKSYSIGDIVGKTGIESSMESVLKGEKGSKKLVVDNQGIVRSISDEKPAVSGNDVYLTIDHDLQIGAYHLLEQHLAGILYSKIVNYDYVATPNTVSSNIMIPVKDVYFQLINNNVLDLKHFYSDKASDNEKAIADIFDSTRENMLKTLCSIILDENSKVNDAYSEDISESLNYVFTLLKENEIIKSDSLDASVGFYKKWLADEISLRNFLTSALTAGWIDVTKIGLHSKYSDTEQTIEALVNTISGLLSEDSNFSKIVFKHLIKNEKISGIRLCMALYDQGILVRDDNTYSKLQNGNSQTAYNFIREKIKNIEITPAQLALDPCSGSVVLTDIKTGEVLALVTYPSYDNNRITTESGYLYQLTQNKSLPLYSRATQTRTAPGSIFKPITALAGMAENVITPDETIETANNGTFTEAGYTLKCWIAPRNHGTVGIASALEKSCNYFFSEVAYRMALTGNGSYNENKGIQTLQKYSQLFGLGQNSGIEISEASPHVTDSDAVPSGIGQGTHNYTNTQINRYVSAIASRGEVLDLNLIYKTTDSKGETLTKSEKNVINQLDFTDQQWNVVYQGMHQAVYANKNYSKWFSILDFDVAGKTGTAQEDKKRGNHANFICFAPYSNPNVAISVSIPYGYTAANSVSVASDVLAYYYKKISLETIMSQSAQSQSGADVTD